MEPDSLLDLGNRTIRIVPTPGHAKNSIALYDEDAKQLFIGDYMMPGILGVSKLLIPDSSLDDTVITANHLVRKVDEDTVIYCSHAFDYSLPVLHYRDISDLADFLNKNSSKKGKLPKFKKINENMKILY